MKLFFAVIPQNHDFFTQIPFEISHSYQFAMNYEKRWERIEFDECNFICYKPNWDEFLKMIDVGVVCDTQYQKLTEDSLEPLLKIYSDGFLKGYNEFELVIKNSVGILSSNEYTCSKIFQYINKPGNFPVTGIYTSYDDDPFNYIEESTWYDDAVQAGYYYKAWYIIVNSPEAFLKFFRLDDDIYQLYKSSFDFLIHTNHVESDDLNSYFLNGTDSIIDNLKYVMLKIDQDKQLDVFSKNSEAEKLRASFNPSYLLSFKKLTDFYFKFKGEIFNGQLNEFHMLFDVKNPLVVKIEIKPGKMEYFYFMLNQMYCKSEIFVDDDKSRKSEIIQGILDQVGGKLKTFQNLRIEKSPNNKYRQFKKDVKVLLNGSDS
ncbi:MAG: hypothetical protein ACOH2A_13620 [Sphingobacteriaceae bacterium]